MQILPHIARTPAYPINARLRIFAAVFLAFSTAAQCQQASPDITPPKAGSNWGSVKALPATTKVHITMNHGGRTCRIFAVTDDTLTCAKGNGAGPVLQRAEIKHIKLAHYVRSTLVGAGIGGGAGAIAGGIGGRTKPCPPGNGFCLNGIGLGAGAVALVFGVVGAAVVGVVGGVTDMARGSSIYTRP
jgi:hypothetical protein